MNTQQCKLESMVATVAWLQFLLVEGRARFTQTWRALKSACTCCWRLSVWLLESSSFPVLSTRQSSDQSPSTWSAKKWASTRISQVVVVWDWWEIRDDHVSQRPTYMTGCGWEGLQWTDQWHSKRRTPEMREWESPATQCPLTTLTLQMQFWKAMALITQMQLSCHRNHLDPSTPPRTPNEIDEAVSGLSFCVILNAVN